MGEAVDEILIAADAVKAHDGAVIEALVRATDHFALSSAAERFRTWNGVQWRLQNSEFLSTFHDWVDRHNPRFSYESLARSFWLHSNRARRTRRLGAFESRRVIAWRDCWTIVAYFAFQRHPSFRRAATPQFRS
jgi:hypothetical protein